MGTFAHEQNKMWQMTNIVLKGITNYHKFLYVWYLNRELWQYLLHGEALLVITTVDPEHVSLELKKTSFRFHNQISIRNK